MPVFILKIRQSCPQELINVSRKNAIRWNGLEFSLTLGSEGLAVANLLKELDGGVTLKRCASWSSNGAVKQGWTKKYKTVSGFNTAAEFVFQVGKRKFARVSTELSALPQLRFALSSVKTDQSGSYFDFFLWLYQRALNAYLKLCTIVLISSTDSQREYSNTTKLISKDWKLDCW